jgi:type II secretory pathway pseudopilin PulG
MKSRRRRWLCWRNEDGFALATVMATTAILIVLTSAAVAYGVGSQNISRHDQDWNAALSAAEAGIDDYIFRLNENSNYWLYNAGNLPPDGNKAFIQWVPVAGGSTLSQYRYDINATTITTNGVIKITSTGRVNDTERTVYASLRRRSFIDYLYFTDFETKDPASYTGTPFTAAQAQTQCAKYFYGGRNSSCTDINFVSGDAINGPLHSNDAYLVCGTPAFNGETSTSWSGASGLRYRLNTGCTNHPTFANAGDPKQLPPLTMPPSNSSIKAETLAGRGGCLYTGPTRIKLNNNGTMTVNSPFSKQTNNSPCPKSGTGALPSNGVIYVQNVPSVTTDPNYTNGCPYSVGGRAHPLGLPIASDLNIYGCRNGDVFIEGTLDGQLTVASENNIDVTWNVTYTGGLGGDDLLGLVANNYVEVYHPVSCTSGNSTSCNLNANFPNETARNAKFLNPTIQAAILSVNHSFWVQRYDVGAASALGTLHIDGAIAQRYRGPVGTTSSGTPNTGYVKQYVYDQRLKYLSPPKFLDPVASSWGVATWAENNVPAAYR